MAVTDLQRRLINQFQGGVPATRHPYRDMARILRCHEASVIDALRDLLSQGMLSRFGPLYDAERLGGGLTLAAMAVPEASYDAVTELVNAYPEVAHNYRRDHALNMWFVVATQTPEQVAGVLHAIQRQSGIEVFDFPRQHEFYIGLWLDLKLNGEVCTVAVPGRPCQSQSGLVMDDLDRSIIQLSQPGLAIEAEPWDKIASRTGCPTDEILRRVTGMLNAGAIRRIGAVPNHYRLGLRGNGMTVWDIPDDRVHRAGEKIGALDFVSHCYLRPRRENVWNYNLFAMVHGQDRREVEAKYARIAALLGDDCRAHDILFSSAILKKTGMRLAA